MLTYTETELSHLAWFTVKWITWRRIKKDGNIIKLKSIQISGGCNLLIFFSKECRKQTGEHLQVFNAVWRNNFSISLFLLNHCCCVFNPYCVNHLMRIRFYVMRYKCWEHQEIWDNNDLVIGNLSDLLNQNLIQRL